MVSNVSYSSIIRIVTVRKLKVFVHRLVTIGGGSQCVEFVVSCCLHHDLILCKIHAGCFEIAVVEYVDVTLEHGVILKKVLKIVIPVGRTWVRDGKRVCGRCFGGHDIRRRG